jgi:8-oxo-dGTP diphosphatase
MPVLGVNVAIIKESKVLLTKRRDFEVWCLPGGEVEEGESLAQAALREAKEEVGYTVRLERLVGIHSRPQWLSVGGHIAVFTASIIGGDLEVQADEVVEAGFFSADELPLEMVLGGKQQVMDALNGVTGAVWTHDSQWNLQAGLTRPQLYALLEQSGLSPAEFYLTRLAKPISGGDRLEVAGKVDVY